MSTDRRNPTVNANGLIYGSLELSADYLPVLDPVRHTTTQVQVDRARREPRRARRRTMPHPSPYWGDEVIWTSRNNVHNPMFDRSRPRVDDVSASGRPTIRRSASRDRPIHRRKLTPVERASRHLAIYDPKDGKITHISTCFGTHHLMFAEDANNTLWTSGGGPVVGWLNTKMFDETGDEVKSQGWTALILDTNGNGKRDEGYVEPNAAGRSHEGQALRRRVLLGGARARRIGLGHGARLPRRGRPAESRRQSARRRRSRKSTSRRSTTRRSPGFSPRGGDVDRNGVFWAALASGHLASFDRRKCKGPLNGPKATGQHCPEGWTLYAEPLPQLKGVTEGGSAEGSYYTWVDQFDTLGLGRNMPINTGNVSEGLLALKDGKWVVMRVPYPLGFYTKWMDGRIDDAKAGWKGKGCGRP